MARARLRVAWGLAALLCLALEASQVEAAQSSTFQPSTADSFIQQDKPTLNNGTTPTFTVTGNPSKVRRALVRFDLTTIPTDAAIKTATLSLFMTAAPGASRTFGAHRITGATLWTEGGVTWNSRDGTTNWTTAGGDFTAAATGTTLTGTANNVLLNWSIKSDVQAWFDGSAVNNGSLIKDETEGTNNTATFAAKENTTAANRPKLVVTYLLKVRDLTATAGNTQVTLNWVLPGGSPDYNGTLVIRKAGSAPTASPVDGTAYTAGTSTLSDGSLVVFNNTALATTVTDTGLTNGTQTYYYQAFARDSSNQYSLASTTVNSTPTSTIAPDPQWSYATSAASMAAPGLTPNGVVVSGSNDNKLHGMKASDGTRDFAPFATGGAIQSRPPVIPATSSSSGADVAYVTSQDGRVYAVNTNTGAQVWQSAVLGTQLQGGAAVWLQSFQALTIGGATADAVIVGTRNGATNNQVYALNGNTGAILWTFNPGNMDIISSTPFVDYDNNVIWVTSRSNAGTQASLWKLNAATGALLASFNLGDIDSSPVSNVEITVPFGAGAFRYVGTNAGELKAIRVSDGVVFTHTPASGTGAVKGFPLSFSSVTPSVAPPDTIVFTRDTTVHAVSFNGSTFSVLWTTTLTGAPTVSAPIDDGASKLYVGASDGKVHQLRLSDGVDEFQRTIVPGTPTVGDPSFDIFGRVYVGATDGHIYSFGAPF